MKTEHYIEKFYAKYFNKKEKQQVFTEEKMLFCSGFQTECLARHEYRVGNLLLICFCQNLQMLELATHGFISDNWELIRKSQKKLYAEFEQEKQK